MNVTLGRDRNGFIFGSEGFVVEGRGVVRLDEELKIGFGMRLNHLDFMITFYRIFILASPLSRRCIWISWPTSPLWLGSISIGCRTPIRWQ
jgi:hypothetical protein